jgi:hypothetical protein
MLLNLYLENTSALNVWRKIVQVFCAITQKYLSFLQAAQTKKNQNLVMKNFKG